MSPTFFLLDSFYDSKIEYVAKLILEVGFYLGLFLRIFVLNIR